MKRVYLALPTADAVAGAIRKRLKRKKSAKRLKVVKRLDSAHVVVTSSGDIGTLPERLPESVELLQLIDCGGGQRYRDAPNLTITNASNLLDTDIATVSLCVVIDAAMEFRQCDESRLLQLGIVGLGNLARETLDMLFQSIETLITRDSIERPYHLDRVAVSDIRTPRQGHLHHLQHRFSRFGIAVRRVTLDQLLSTSDIVIVSVHHGPTADPLIGRREARLLDPKSWVIDASEERVVDPSAFDSLDQGRPLPTYMRVDEIPRDRFASLCVNLGDDPDEIANYVGWNLRRFDKGQPILTVEHVDFPSAGDPAFWSSRMDPREF